jgi:proteasome lid subunit RPN8/RPN11
VLRISKALQAEVVAHCQTRYPKEACGLLAGPVAGSGSERQAIQVYPMTNVEDSPIGYAMDPREQLRVEKLMRQRGQRLVGIYHSHTATDAYPSPVDVRLALSPDLSYVLVSLKDQAAPDFKSYVIDGATIAPEAIEAAPA